MKIKAYCDTNDATYPMTRRSVIDFCIKLRRSLISWKTKKQSTMPLSSIELEYQAMAKTVSKIIWIRGPLLDLGVEIDGATELFCNNDAALKLAANPVFHEGTKHI